MRRSLGGPTPPGNLHAVPHGVQGVEGGPHIQDGELVGVFVDFTIVVVDDVAHLLPTAIDDPVVTVEWQLVPTETLSYQHRNHLRRRGDS